MRARLLLAGLLVPAAAMAAVEVTPLAGYRAGRLEIQTGVGCIQSPCPSFAQSEDSLLYGAILDVPINGSYEFEVLINRQPSELSFGERIPVPRRPLSTVDFDVTHLHAGLMRVWRLASLEPFVAASGGQTWIDATSPLIGDVDLRRWSGSLGVGARVPLGNYYRYGLRIEARGYYVDIPSHGLVDVELPRALDKELTQFETTVGVSFRF